MCQDINAGSCILSSCPTIILTTENQQEIAESDFIIDKMQKSG